MNFTKSCSGENDNKVTKISCRICSKEMDVLLSNVSENQEDSIYTCRGSIIQKIFVYGKYIGGRYGALSFNKYYTKKDCEDKICEKNINNILLAINEEEYSRYISCNRGMMNAIVLTKNMVKIRKNDLIAGKLDHIIPEYNNNGKYYCHSHAQENNFKCSCGEELLRIDSTEYRDFAGMEDQTFIELYLPEVLTLE